jgi:uncharacterized membrane protein YkoI
MKRLSKLLAAVAALAALALGGAAIAGAVSDPDRPGDDTTAQQARERPDLAAEGEDDDKDDGTEEAEDDVREQAGGPQAERATAAALDATGGGRANSVERDSEAGATWEVEVTKRDGSTVDVRLDASYRVVVIEVESE